MMPVQIRRDCERVQIAHKQSRLPPKGYNLVYDPKYCSKALPVWEGPSWQYQSKYCSMAHYFFLAVISESRKASGKTIAFIFPSSRRENRATLDLLVQREGKIKATAGQRINIS